MLVAAHAGAPAHRLGEGAGDGDADRGHPARAALPGGPAEPVEDPGALRLGDRRPAVGDLHHHHLGLGPAGHPGVAPPVHRPARVDHQLGEGAPGEPAVGERGGEAAQAGAERGGMVGIQPGVGEAVAQRRAEVDRLGAELQPAGGGGAEGGQVVDQRVEALDRGEHLAGHLGAGGRVEGVAGLGEELGMAHGHRDRGAQLVGDQGEQVTAPAGLADPGVAQGEQAQRAAALAEGADVHLQGVAGLLPGDHREQPAAAGLEAGAGDRTGDVGAARAPIAADQHRAEVLPGQRLRVALQQAGSGRVGRHHRAGGVDGEQGGRGDREGAAQVGRRGGHRASIAPRPAAGPAGALTAPAATMPRPMDLRHCVIPAAGLGSRFLPATKALPKELLPVLDRPVLQWGVEEAVAAGLDTMVVVLGRGKELIAAHFDRSPELNQALEARQKRDELDCVRRVERLAHMVYVYQPEPLGLGHAVLCARPAVGDRPFACLLPDDLSWGARPVLAQLVEAHAQTQTPILALMRVPHDRIGRYGAAAVTETRGRLHRVVGMVEKPAPGQAPSDLAIMGRYILTPAVFDALERTRPGAGGEIQLTDGIAGALQAGPVWGLEFDGELLDVGTPTGWLQTLVRTAQDHPVFGPALRDALPSTAPA